MHLRLGRNLLAVHSVALMVVLGVFGLTSVAASSRSEPLATELAKFF